MVKKFKTFLRAIWKKLFVVKFQSGLGNQLFIYAFGQALKKQNPDARIVYDLASYETFYMPYVLYKFKIDDFEVADESTLRFKKNTLINKVLRRLTKDYNPYANLNYFNCERVNGGHRFNASLLTLEESTYFDGYFESEKHFEVIKRDLARQYTFKSYSQYFANKIDSAPNAVALHIRRGVKCS